MPENIPVTGDVVIHSSGHDATPTYGICAVPDRRDALNEGGIGISLRVERQGAGQLS